MTRPGAHRLAARTGIALLALSVAAAVVRSGAATIITTADSIRATQIAPGNARAAIAAARARVEAGEDPASGRVQRLVQAALARDLTQPGAIELRALQRVKEGDVHLANRLVDLSSAISRRSLPTHLWLIQRSVDRGDVSGALKHFDLALQTSATAPDILFPVLAGALSDPTLVAPIARLLDRPSDWRVTFLSYAISDAGAAANVAGVVLKMRDKAAIVDNQVDQLLIGKLIQQDQFVRARQVHDAFRPRINDAVNDPDFANASATYPFGWGLMDSADAGAARDIVAGKPALTYWTTPGGEGQVATQLLMLAPGIYRLASRNSTAPADPSPQPVWTVTCAGRKGRQIALLRQGIAAGQVTAMDFSVPDGCIAQWLALTLASSDASIGQSGAIGSISVTRL